MRDRTPALVVFGFLAAAATLIYLGHKPKTLPAPTAPEEGRREVVEAFEQPADGEVPAGIHRLFDELGAELRRGDGTRIVNHFDPDRLIQEIDREGQLARAGANDARARDGLRQGLAAGMTKKAVVLRWDATEVRRLRWLVPGREAVVIARHTTSVLGEEVRFKMRWWVIRDGDRWRVYDLEDLSLGGRFSQLVGLVVAEGLRGGRLPDWARPEVTGAINDGMVAVLNGDHAEAERRVSAIRPGLLPRPLEAVRQVVLALAKEGLGRWDEALRACDEAEACNPDMPLVHFVRAVAYNQLGKFEEAVASGRKYVEALGPEADAYLQIGVALSRLGRHEEAAEALRAGLDDQPNFPEILDELRRCLPADRKEEVGRRFAALRDPAGQFGRLLNEALADEDFEGAEVLIEARRRQAPADPEVLFQYARLRDRQDRPDEAFRLFPRALELAPPQRRPEYLSTFLAAMAGRGRHLEAYRTLADADATAAFRQLASDLLDDLDDDESDPDALGKLEKLMAAHRKRMPDDPWLNFYEGELCLVRRDYDGAERAFSEGMKKDLDGEDREEFRDRRLEACYRGGKGLWAYANVGPRKEVFDRLVWRYAGDRDADGLEALLRAHRKAEPRDVDLALWQAEVHWLRGEHAQVVTELESFRRNAKDEKRQQWRVTDRLVRSLARLGRFAAARREAKRNATAGPLLRAVPEALAGDAAGLERELDACAQRGFHPVTFYADPDVGRALRTEPFRKLREKYPEPAPPKDRPLKQT